MIQAATEFDHGPISATSTRGTDPNELWTGTFDFALIGSSWDKRCLALKNCDNLTFESSLEIMPSVEGDAGLLDTHHGVLAEFCARKSHDHHVTTSHTSGLSETFTEVRSRLWAAINHPDRRRPARVFIDVSTCPRYFSLAVLGEAFRSGLVGEIVIAYSEGRYPDAAPSYDNLEDISFTDGAFHSVPVPGFFGEFEPSKGVFYLVSTGFDGWKTLNLLVRKEPGRVAALIASPGVSPDYERRALAANAALFQRFGIGEHQMIKATAGDAVEAWRKITEAGLENLESENAYFLCSGNKAHSVALALRAMVEETPTLLYNRPAQHLPSDVECSGVHWAYAVKPTAGTVFG